MARVNKFPAFVGSYLTHEQRRKLEWLAAVGGWTMGQALRALIDAAELTPPQVRVAVSLPEPTADVGTKP